MAKRSKSAPSHPFRVDITPSEELEGAELAALAHHIPSEALRRCLPGLCPWCVLKCRHGDVEQALQSWTRRKADMPSDCNRGRFMLMHCKNWLVALCKADMKGELKEGEVAQEGFLDPSMDTVFNLFTGGGGSSSSSRSTANKITCPRPREQRADAPDSEPPPPPPPAHVGDDSYGRSNTPPPPPPPLQVPGAGMHPHGVLEAALGNQPWSPDIVWQYWAGRRGKWQNYSAEVSASLTRMAAHGPVEAEFLIAGANYRINVQTMNQDNMATDQPPRSIRVRPVEEAG